MDSQVSGHKFRISCLKSQVPGFGFRVSDCTAALRWPFRVPDSGSRVSVFAFRISDFGYRIPRTPEILGVGSHRRLALAEGEQPLLGRLLSARRPLLQGLGISVSGFGFRGSGVRSRVSRIEGSGFTVQGEGCKV